MKREDHIISTGGKGEEVHTCLDRFFWRFGYDHRVVLHHKLGIDLIVKEFGEEARWIAEQHIKDDWGGKIPETYYDRNYYRKEWATDMDIFIRAFEFAKTLFRASEFAEKYAKKL